MASYVPIRAITHAKEMIKSEPLDRLAVRLCDQVAKMIWQYAPWTWTIGALNPATLVAATSDYTIGSFPADFQHIQRAYLQNTVNGKILRKLVIVESLPNVANEIFGVPRTIAHAGTDVVRIHPVYGPTGLPSATVKLVSWYKKTTPAVTAATIQTAGSLVMDDDWSWVFEEGVLWKAYQYAFDQRAGSAQVDSKGNAQYTGQLGVFMAALAEMKRQEVTPETLFELADEDRKEANA